MAEASLDVLDFSVLLSKKNVTPKTDLVFPPKTILIFMSWKKFNVNISINRYNAPCSKQKCLYSKSITNVNHKFSVF